MEPATVVPNKYTIGKFLRNKKGIHKADPQAHNFTPPEHLQKYIDYLKSKGAEMPKLTTAEFRLKNGLPYTGLIATEKIITEELIVKMPRELLLTTKKAFFSDVRKVFLDNPKFFSPYLTSNWEDRMLLVFLLYEHQKGEASSWYYLLSNLSRDIDYVVFWDEEELNLLEDKNVSRIAKRRRNQYNMEEAYILDLGKKYPGLLDPNIFTHENVRWIYTHLITRCFGKYLEYVTMVPFAEFFNHECSDVFYDLQFYENNPNIPKDYDMPAAQEVPDEEIENYETSEGSYDSDDQEFDSDFEYDDDEAKENNAFSEFTQGKKEESMFPNAITSKLKEIQEFLVNELDWSDGFSIFFVREIYKEALAIQNNFETKKVSMNAAMNAFKPIENAMASFKDKTRAFYKQIYDIDEKDVVIKQKENILKMAAEEKKNQEEAKDETEIKECFAPDEKWKDDAFDNFVMKASWRDQFEKGSQVYFCYGRLSNRLMLIRYGLALEYNKYEHIHFKVPYLKYFKDTPWIVEKVKSCRLSRYMRFKLKRTCVNASFINFCKAISMSSVALKKNGLDVVVMPKHMDSEIKGLDKACELLEDYLDEFTNDEDGYRAIRNDPKTGYHKYFAAVFCLEKQRLVRFHLRAMHVLKAILKRIKDGYENFNEVLERIEELEDADEYQRNRYFLRKYLDRLRFTLESSGK